MRHSVLTITLMLWTCVGSVAHACSTHGAIAAADINFQASGISGDAVAGTLTLGSSLVAPTSTTTCAAGVGLGTLADSLPAGVDVTGLAIVVVHADGSRTPLGAFSFVPNAMTSATLAAGAGSSGPPGTNPLFAGSTWFGFSSVVNPFVLPPLGPDEFTAMQFTVEVAEPLLPLVLNAQFAGGEALTDGTPIFSGDHPAQYFTAENRSVTFVPEPASLVLLMLAASCLATCRRHTHVR